MSCLSSKPADVDFGLDAKRVTHARPVLPLRAGVVRMARIVCRWACSAATWSLGGYGVAVCVRVVEGDVGQVAAGVSAAVDSLSDALQLYSKHGALGARQPWIARNAFRVSPLASRGSSAEGMCRKGR